MRSESATQRGWNHGREAVFVRQQAAQPRHEPIKQTLLRIVIAVADADPSRMAPNAGRQEQALVHLRDARDQEIATMIAENRANSLRWEMKRAIQQKYLAMLPQADISDVLKNSMHIWKS